jgi:zinc protease
MSALVTENQFSPRLSVEYSLTTSTVIHGGYARYFKTPPFESVEHLDNITLRDTADWLLLHSNSTNMNLVIVGNIKPHDAIRKARDHFESVRMGPASVPAFVLPVNKVINRRIKVPHDYSESRIYIVWNIPGFNSLDRIGFELLVEVLRGDPNSRGFDQMVGEKKIADIEGELRVRELASQFVLWATVANPNSFSAIEDQMRQQIDRIKRLGIPNDELQTARFRLSTKMSHGFERMVGPGSEAELLSLSWMFSRDSSPYIRSLACIASITAAHLQQLAGILEEPALVLEIEGNQTKPRNPAGLYINTTARHPPVSRILIAAHLPLL